MVFIVLFCGTAIAVGVITYRYLTLGKRLQNNPQVGSAHGRDENCVANGSAVRYDTSQAINGSPCINRGNGNEGNSVTIARNGSPCRPEHP